MKAASSLRLFYALAFVVLGSVAFTSNTSAADETVLFDGTHTDHWRGFQKEGVPDGWKIEDGTLTHSGNVGDLITREQYGDFDLTIEWKISEAGNSGIIYRCTEDEPASYMTGIEYQVLDNDKHADGASTLTSTAAIYALYPPTVDATRPIGEWNETRIRIKEGLIEHWLNGKMVAEADLGSDEWNAKVNKSKFNAWKKFGTKKRGHIALQDHNDPVWYRNIRITRLDEEHSESSHAEASHGVSAKQPVRILLVSQSAGFQHPTVTRKPHELSHTEQVMTKLGISSGEFRVDCTQDVATDFTPELVENYDIVMFYTTGELPIPVEIREWFLNDWLKQPGNAFLGVHSAADTYMNYKPYVDMICGSFSGHPWNANTTVTVKVHDTNHPAAQPWGESFVIQDEIYQFKNWQPEKVRVLMSLDMEKTDLKKPYHVPVCWVREYGEGRVMHMSLGHREDVWTNPTYQESLTAGIRWLTGQVDGDATPNPELSTAQEQAAREATQAAAVGG